jgi:hypothetical protein
MYKWLLIVFSEVSDETNSRYHMQLMHHVCRLIFLQPGEMSLEEIEERLSSSVKAETISQLKSTVWKERLEG